MTGSVEAAVTALTDRPVRESIRPTVPMSALCETRVRAGSTSMTWPIPWHGV
jgi:hypothetical protein